MQQNDPLISVVLPTHNGARFISQSIESVLAQTCSPLELIIVNDGSTDNTVEVLNRYNDPRVRILHNERNVGLPQALNMGFRASRGVYLTWTSDDNWYAPDAFDTMRRVLEEYTDVAFVYADYTIVDENGVVLRECSVGEPESLTESNQIGPCWLYRRQVYERVGEFSDTFRLAEDYHYWLGVWRWFTMKPLHKPLYYYRYHSGSLTSTYGGKRVRRVMHLALLDRLGDADEIPPLIRAQVHLWVALDKFDQGNLQECRQYLELAFRLGGSELANATTLVRQIMKYLLFVYGDSVEGLSEAQRFVRRLFTSCSDFFRNASVERAIIGQLYELNVFKGHQLQDASVVRKAAIKLAWYQPEAFRNRGLVSTVTEAYLGQRATAHLREVLHSVSRRKNG